MSDDAERADDDGEHPLAPEDQREPAGVDETSVINYSAHSRIHPRLMKAMKEWP